MRIIKPGTDKVVNGAAYNPAWFDDWLRNQGKWIELTCGCIEDIHLPSCLTLVTGKDIQILCSNDHGFQSVKRSVSFKEAMQHKGFIIPDDNSNEPLF